MVNAHNRYDLNAVFHPRTRGVWRRVALSTLMLGWSAFWLLAVMQPCCKLAVTQAHATAAATTPHTADPAHHDDGHHPAAPANRSDRCGGVTTVPHAVVAALTAVPALEGGKASPADYDESLLQRYGLPRVDDTFRHPPSLPPPRAVAAFHLRTSRILI
jgi:hypothetical protein